MKVDVRLRCLESSHALQDHAVRRVHFELNRFEGVVSSVEVHVSDLNGPRGRIDTHCRVAVKGRRLSHITVDDLSGDAYSALDMALERASRAIEREIEGSRRLSAHAPLSRRAS